MKTTSSAKMAKLEAIIGPATEIIASGGVSVDPQTGAVEDRWHGHWRLADPTAPRKNMRD